MPRVSAIVLNYKEPQLTVQCVESLLKQTCIEELEILVVDNNSQNDSIGVLRNRLSQYPSVRFIESQENVGYGKGNNLGVEYASGDYILITNPDNQLEEGGIDALRAYLEEHPDVGVVAPRLVHEDGTVRDSARNFPRVTDLIIKRTFLRRLFPKRLEKYLQSDEIGTEPRETEWIPGACFLMKWSFYNELGGFDPRYFMFFEDADMCRECWKRGKKVVYHPGIKASDRKKRLSEGGVCAIVFRRIGWMHIASAMRYFAKWGFR